MKQDYVTAGVVLVAVGVIFLLIGNNIDNPFDSKGKFLMFFGIALLLFGIGLSVAGATEQGQKKQIVCSSRARFCPKCGREIPFDAVVCPYCQYDFK